MTLAHGPNWGPNIEALILGAPLVVLGLSLYFRKTSNAAVPFALMGAGALLSIGAFTFLSHDSHPVAPAGGNSDGVDAAYLAALDGLCLAQQAADERDVEGALDKFESLSHGGLHEIAAAVGAKDRGLEADLLVAMQKVEADFDSPDGQEPLPHDIDALIDATGSALDALDIDQNGCAA